MELLADIGVKGRKNWRDDIDEWSGRGEREGFAKTQKEREQGSGAALSS